MRGILAVATAIALLSVSAISLNMPATEPAAQLAPMSLWEAYSRGYATIEATDVWYNGSTDSGFTVRNTGSVPVAISEFVMLLSPNPRQTLWPGEPTTQDGLIVNATVPPGGFVNYTWGNAVAYGVFPPPPWWCTEGYQGIFPGVFVTLGGEILPFELWALAGTLIPMPDGTQDGLWRYLETYPVVVVGKTVNGAFWKAVSGTAGQSLAVELHATNLAVRRSDDGIPDPNATNARVWDVVPPGFVIDDASIAPSGYVKTTLPDGSVRLSWNTSLPAADITSMMFDNTPYVSKKFSYSMKTPALPAGRTTLPRGRVSVGPDFTAEAHSAEVVLEAANVPQPPIADAGPGYSGYEGDVITFSAAGSSDPNGDPLKFRWDFTADGTWDTSWSSSATATFTYPDDFSGNVRVEVTDGTFNVTDEAPVAVQNVTPTVGAGTDRSVSEGSAVAFTATFSDPGFDSPAMGTVEDFTATVDWGYGPPESASVTESPGGPGVPTTGTVSLSHVYGDDGTFPVTVTVCDDDGGCGSDAIVVTVSNVAPAVDYTIAMSGNEGDSRKFEAHATDPGSDDLLFTWSGSCTGWSRPTPYANDPAIYPDPDPSPEVNPRDVTDSQFAYCGDNGVFDWRVEVADDDGGVTVVSGTFDVANLPPSLTTPPSQPGPADEGGEITLGATATDPGSDDLTFDWAWQYLSPDSHTYYNDGTGPDPPESPNGTYPFTASDTSTRIYGDNGVYMVGLTITDDDGGYITYSTRVRVDNVPPAVDGMPDASTDEGSLMSFTFSFSDPGFDFPPAGTLEDFTADVDWGDGTSDGPSVDEVPGGPGVPTTGTIAADHTYADNGEYTVTVTVCDDDGGCGDTSFLVAVDNVAPTVDAVADQMTDEGALLSLNATFSDPGFDFPPAGTLEDFTASVDWGDTISDSLGVNETPGGPGVPTTGVVPASHFYADNGVYVATITVCDDDGGCGEASFTVTVNNVAPTVDAGPDVGTMEATPLSLTFSFGDPGFDFPPMGTVEDFAATVDWGYGPPESVSLIEVPGGPGVPTTGTIEAAHVYGDNGDFTVTVTVCDDDGGCGTGTLTVTVGNVPPTIDDVQAYVDANLTLRVAGEKWHDVCMVLVHDGNAEGEACVTRYPGSPDDQSATITGRIELLGDFRIVLYYTPDDDPVNGQPNGANPAWVIVTFPDGYEVRFQHTFNVRHEDTWNWTVDEIRPYLVGQEILFEGTASDVGSDDLTFTWDFGDGGSASATYYNDGIGPDPFPSPEVNPITATDVVRHAFVVAGTYSVALTVTDDDGGSASVTVAISVGG